MRYAIITALLAAACGCKASPDGASLLDVAFDRRANNVALLFGWQGPDGAQGSLPGTGPDLVRLESLYRSSDFGFQVTVIKDPTKARIMDASAAAARSVGERGTLVWHFEGHGSSDGRLRANDAGFSFAEVAAAMKNARTTPIKRLVVTADACYSGAVVAGLELASPSDEATDADATVPVGASGGENQELETDLSQAADAMADAALASFVDGADAVEDAGGLSLASTRLYEQVLVMSSAMSTQTAADWGGGDPASTRNGGPFNQAWTQTLRSFAAGRRGATFADLTSEVRRVVLATTSNRQSPTFRMSPTSLGQERLFDGGAPPAAPSPIVQPPTVTPPPQAAATCQGAWGFAWAPSHARSGATCRVATSFCQCWAHQQGCALFAKGASVDARPISAAVAADAGGGCYEACTALARANKPLMQRQCGTSLVMLNRAKQLEVWDYAAQLATQPASPQPSPGPVATSPASPPASPGGATAACTCYRNASNQCFLVKNGQNIAVGAPAPTCAQSCYDNASRNGCRY